MKTSENGHTETVKVLIEQEGIDINAKGIFLQHSVLQHSKPIELFLWFISFL